MTENWDEEIKKIMKLLDDAKICHAFACFQNYLADQTNDRSMALATLGTIAVGMDMTTKALIRTMEWKSGLCRCGGCSCPCLWL
jgi:hypothetical protein